MSRFVNIGNVTVGEGMPKICVPIMPRDIQSVYNDAERIIRSPADIIELRADHAADNKNAGSLIGLLEAVKSSIPGRPVLFTMRTSYEGGRAELTADEYVEICRAAIGSGMADAVDIEYSWGDDTVKGLAEYAAGSGAVPVISLHNFDRTPASVDIVKIMKSMRQLNAGIVKMAVMPADNNDMAEVFRASEVLKRELDVPFILIAMSSAGTVSRIGAEQLGSSITFASAGGASAPGQIDADDLDRILRVLHKTPEAAAAERKSKRALPEDPGIALIGFMGTGKTTVANEIRRMTGMKLLEIDDMIADDAGMSIPEIFRKYGEAHFRDLEEKICGKAVSGKASVISCGGGTVMRRENVERLREGSVLILLDASPDTVYERVKRSASDRPLLVEHMSRGYISWLMKQRNSAYRRAADHIINVDGRTSAMAAAEIVRLMKNGFSGN